MKINLDDDFMKALEIRKINVKTNKRNGFMFNEKISDWIKNCFIKTSDGIANDGMHNKKILCSSTH